MSVKMLLFLQKRTEVCHVNRNEKKLRSYLFEEVSVK